MLTFASFLRKKRMQYVANDLSEDNDAKKGSINSIGRWNRLLSLGANAEPAGEQRLVIKKRGGVQKSHKKAKGQPKGIRFLKRNAVYV